MSLQCLRAKKKTEENGVAERYSQTETNWVGTMPNGWIDIAKQVLGIQSTHS